MNKEEYLKKINGHYRKLVSNLKGEKLVNADMACRAFKESMQRLANRHSELLSIESVLINYDTAEVEVSLDDVQLRYVDKTEAFHQAIYSTISTFILLLKQSTARDFREQLPKNSVQKFLRYVSEKSYESIIGDQASYLIKSADFRGKFVDHPQGHAQHDWMTYHFKGEACIIYFIRDGNEVYAVKPQSPYSPTFKPAIAHKSFYVSPSHMQVFIALVHFTEKLLKSLSSISKCKSD